MDVILFTVEFPEFCSKVFTDFGCDHPQCINVLLSENFLAVLRDKDQMNMKFEDTMSSGSD